MGRTRCISVVQSRRSLWRMSARSCEKGASIAKASSLAMRSKCAARRVGHLGAAEAGLQDQLTPSSEVLSQKLRRQHGCRRENQSISLGTGERSYKGMEAGIALKPLLV